MTVFRIRQRARLAFLSTSEQRGLGIRRCDVPQPKVPADVREDLLERNLSLWICQHPMIYAENGRSRADTTRVNVQLAGPGIDISPWGNGPNVRSAVDNALMNPYLRTNFPGLDGAMARLEMELRGLEMIMLNQRFKLGRKVEVDSITGVHYYGDIDDDVPF